MNAPIVSVIIPVFNNELYFGKCIDSVLYQSLHDIEVIIVNDGSTDNSIKIVEERIRLDDRIKVIHLPGPFGAGVARNKGIESASGKWIAFLDSDDYFPDKYVLELLVETSLKHDADVCGGSLYTVDSQDQIINKSIKYQVFNEEGWIKYDDYQFEGGFYRFIYRSDIVKNKISFPELMRYQDPGFLVKILSFTQKFYSVAHYTYAYRKYKNIEMNNDILCDIFSGIEIVYNISKHNSYKRLMQRMHYVYWKVFFKNFKRIIKSKRCFFQSLKILFSIYSPM